MRITLADAADLLGVKPEVLRQQLTEGKAKLPAGTKVTRRGQGKRSRWYLEFWPNTLAQLRQARARGPDAAKGGAKPASAANPEASGGDGPVAGGENSDTKGASHGRPDNGDQGRSGWWF